MLVDSVVLPAPPFGLATTITGMHFLHPLRFDFQVMLPGLSRQSLSRLTSDIPKMTSPDVLVITAHPQMEQSRINRRLMRAARKLPADSPPKVLVRDLYSLYPDYLIDVAAEQALLASARLIVWQHPIQWYSMPPLMKLWVDEVLAFGWAYGPGGTALRGKDLWLVATTGGPHESYHPDHYNRYFFDAF